MDERPIRGRQRVTGNPRAWVRVRIDGTGHETDVRPSAVRDGMTVLTDYPPHTGLRPRPTKHFVDKAGMPTTPAEAAPARRARPAVPAAPTAEQLKNSEGKATE